jgi:hypothetical protein
VDALEEENVSNWTHAICDEDWDRLNPERPSPRTGAGAFERCCWCGDPTFSGLYLRFDPYALPFCEGHV